MKKVLIIHPSLGIGGAEKIIAYLANGLSNKYFTELLLLRDEPNSLTVTSKVNCYYENVYSNNPIIGRHLINGIKDFKKLINAIEKKINETEPEIVVCFDLRVLLATYIVKKKKKFVLLFSERADPYENAIYWSVLLKHIYKRIDYIVFQTEAARRYYGNIVTGKCSIIANPAFKRNLTVTDIYDYQNPYIFSAGRLQYRKGFDISIKAFSLIANKFPNIDYLIFGCGEEKEKLERLIAEYNLKDRIHILPPINNVVDINKKAKLFVMPSRSEGIPNILLEAMMEGIPTVAADCSPGGARMLSDNGKYFRIAENNNPKSLANEIEDALINEEKTNSICLDAQKSIFRFEPNVILEKWIEVFEKVSEDKI